MNELDDISGAIVDAVVNIHMKLRPGISLSIPFEFRNFFSVSPLLRVNQ